MKAAVLNYRYTLVLYTVEPYLTQEGMGWGEGGNFVDGDI